MDKRCFFLAVIFLVSIALDSSAQRKRTEKADEAYDAGEYYEAIDLYKDAYSVIQDKVERNRVVFMIAECYRKTNDPRRAELWYKKAIGRDFPDPIAQLHYAEALKMNMKYEDAIDEYKRYKELVPADPRADNGILSCELALQWMENPIGYEIQDMKYFNSRGIDFSPAFARDDYQLVYFTSSRDEALGNKTHGATGEDFTDIFESKLDRKGKWSVPVPVEGPVNSEFEDGTPSFTEDYETMYFSRCEISKRKTLGCKIFAATRNGENWNTPKPLEILSDSLVAAHPSISADELTLYFVSDIEGGFGGKDLWKITSRGWVGLSIFLQARAVPQ